MDKQWNHKVFGVKPGGFDDLALEVFQMQYKENQVYRAYVDALGTDPEEVRQIESIPFLPIRFFKSHNPVCGDFKPAVIFESSGTTDSVRSRHSVKDTGIYTESFLKGFELFYGPLKDFCFLGLLPSYLERNNSSLVYMVNEFIKRSEHPRSGFYLQDFEALAETLSSLETSGQKTLLIGVSFALLDFAEKYSIPLKHTIVMETGGMKGRRKEMIRMQVHEQLRQAFGLERIHAEYGMTELLSQAYSMGEGRFHTPPWLKVLLREEEDPLAVQKLHKKSVTGAINIIDLANIHSCCFIATDDIGRMYNDWSFEVMGRLDHSDLRGCSLMLPAES